MTATTDYQLYAQLYNLYVHLPIYFVAEKAKEICFVECIILHKSTLLNYFKGEKM